jgi:hypothetical protein
MNPNEDLAHVAARKNTERLAAAASALSSSAATESASKPVNGLIRQCLWPIPSTKTYEVASK